MFRKLNRKPMKRTFMNSGDKPPLLPALQAGLNFLFLRTLLRIPSNDSCLRNKSNGIKNKKPTE